MRMIVTLAGVLPAFCIACDGEPDAASPGDPTSVDPVTTVVSTEELPSTTELQPPTELPASTVLPSTTEVSMVSLADPGAPLYDVLFSVPAGEGGVTFEGGGVDAQLTGPQGFSVAPDGSVWIADTSGLRLLRFDAAGALRAEILTDDDLVGPLFDVAAFEGGVWAWESVPALARDRLVRYSADGALQEAHELPPGLNLVDGLSGIWVDGDGMPWVEMTGGSRLFRAFGDDGRFGPLEADGYEVGDIVVSAPEGDPLDEGVARIIVGGTVFEQPVRDVGSLTFEGAVAGAIALRLEDVGSAPDGTIEVLASVWWVDPTGTALARADYPLDEAADAYVPTDFVAVAPDGRLIAMVPRPDGVDIVVLNAFAIL